MSNSPLVSHTNISPNRTSPRNHVIDTITIHCAVGQVSVESLGKIFEPESRGASSNYGVGYDGRIGMYVEEKDRSWCSSSRENDNRAITIEVACDPSEPYAVNDVAYNALIQLVADICKRNNIKKLLWKNDKSLIGQADKQNMTLHRWFANTLCPATFLINHHADIAEQVNKILGASEVPAQGNAEDVSRPAVIWNFLNEWLGNDYGVAGLMGNLDAESSLNPINLQNTYNTEFNVSDAEYTAQVDAGQRIFVDSAGYGLAQWTYHTRKRGLLEFAVAKGCSIGCLRTQLEFLKKEMEEDFTSLVQTLKNAKSVREASDAVLTVYERPADMGEAVKAKREQMGQVYLKKFTQTNPEPDNTPSEPSTGFPSTPFKVKVLIPDLNFRSTPSMSGTVKGQTGKGVFTITEVKGEWGRLKSGEGWIFLGNPEYCSVLK
jgi:hypothetical protein